MPIVSNTSPLLNLAIIDELALLRQQFGQLIIPSIVQTELRLNTTYPGVPRLEQALRDGWIRVETLASDDSLLQLLQLELDAGEAAAIALAKKHGERQILLDEREGRKKAKALGLIPIGVLGVLLRAKREGQLNAVSHAIKALQDEAGFRLSDHLVHQVLEAAGE
ncbi:MAG: DUF3368 domain-containing protein [Anaerolineales bacterium]|nr:DUF3368 domain-containing protein [Anaerolineales bacterium]